MRIARVVGLLLAVLAAAPAFAQPAASIIAPVVVSGLQPGPRLWKISRDGHVMWVLGTQSPLSKGLEWAPGETAARLREARILLRPPRVKIDADIGFFSGLALLPSAMAARKNPDGKTLAQVLPPALYARWLPLKQRYLGKDRGVEKFRPVFAAGELWAAAIHHAGLTQQDLVWREVSDIVKQTKPDVRSPTVTVKLEDPRKMLKQFRGAALDDTACFERTLTRLESDLGAMRQRANAWAVGDIAALRALPYVDSAQACQDAFFSASVVRERGMGDLDSRAEAAWLVEAEKALREAAVSFATLPIREMLDADGYLAKLRSRGYVVETRD
jgi:TraB/PrgY/gumN family